MISLCMIVKNEDHCLERCLESAKDVVDEIIVVDTGSNDQTIEIAKTYGAKFYHFEWQDDFALARNYSISKASKQWILYLDADEVLQMTQEDKERLINNNKKAEAYIVEIINVDENGTQSTHFNVRMFRNHRNYQFEGALHEQISPSIQAKSNGKQVIHQSRISIEHTGYKLQEYNKKKKGLRNHRIMKKMLAKTPDDPFVLYNYANSLVSLGDLKNGAKHYIKSIKYLNKKAHYAPTVFLHLVHCFLTLKAYNEALKVVVLAQSLYPNYHDMFYLEGICYFHLNDYAQAKTCFEKALTTHANLNYSKRFSNNEKDILKKISLCCKLLGQLKETE